jgi:hypothetical protein
MRRSCVKLGWGALLVWAAGCGGNSTETPPTPPSPTVPPVATAPGCGDAATARDVVEDASFELRATPREGYAVGQEGRFDLTLAARGNYHVNMQYPLSVKLTAPAGVTLPRAELGTEQAAEFAEPRAKFEVPFTATSAGSQRIVAEVDFAVCTPESCMPDCRTVAVNLPIGAAQGAVAP